MLGWMIGTYFIGGAIFAMIHGAWWDVHYAPSWSGQQWLFFWVFWPISLLAELLIGVKQFIPRIERGPVGLSRRQQKHVLFEQKKIELLAKRNEHMDDFNRLLSEQSAALQRVER